MNSVERLAVDGGTEPGFDEPVHFAGVRVSVQRGLREQQLAVERDLEAATAARDQRGSRDPRRPVPEELSRQTGGSIRVASGDAVFDLENVAVVGRLVAHRPTVATAARHVA
jgi:hypothetical protein